MTFGEKLAKLRRENNYTQEQLAQILGVSRQAISKWESDVTFPETDKLIRLGEMFHCSIDYLLKDSIESENEEPKERAVDYFSFFRGMFKERKSQRTILGLPLWHIGLNARGIIAIGIKARGVISFGFLSLGILSFGMLSFGLFAIGVFTLGILSLGCISAGIFAFGAISFGIISFGAVAVGNFSFGALAIGKYVAVGDYAKAQIALGDTQAIGSLLQIIGKPDPEEAEAMQKLLDVHVPGIWSWAKELIKLFLPC